MRIGPWMVLVGCCLVVGLSLPGSSRGQSKAAIFPIGRPFTLAQGFSGAQPVQNVPVDTTASIVPVPGQKVGMIMPRFRKLMGFGNTGVQHGVSPLPPASAFPQIFKSPISPMPFSK